MREDRYTGDPVIAVFDNLLPDSDAIRRRLAETADKELWNGATLVGPHRDDIVFRLDDRPLAAFASQLRAWRQRSGWPQVELGTKMGYSASLISGVESMDKPPTAEFAAACDQAFATPGFDEATGAAGTFMTLYELVAREAYPAFFAPVVTRFKTYGVALAPALQAYCERVLAHPAVARWVNEALLETENARSAVYGAAWAAELGVVHSRFAPRAQPAAARHHRGHDARARAPAQGGFALE